MSVGVMKDYKLKQRDLRSHTLGVFFLGEKKTVGPGFGKLRLLRFRGAITFFFGITVFLYQNQNPMLKIAFENILCSRVSGKEPTGHCKSWPLKCALL